MEFTPPVYENNVSNVHIVLKTYLFQMAFADV